MAFPAAALVIGVIVALAATAFVIRVAVATVAAATAAFVAFAVRVAAALCDNAGIIASCPFPGVLLALRVNITSYVNLPSGETARRRAGGVPFN